MKTFRAKMAGFTLVEIMIVVLIIGILLAIAIPNFVQAREAGRAKACVGNLKQIDSAKQQCAMDNKLSGTDTTSTFLLDGATASAGTAGTAGGSWQLVSKADGSAPSYIRTVPACPSSGAYDPGTGVATTPKCSVGTAGTGDYAGPQSSTSVATPGKYYHGL